MYGSWKTDISGTSVDSGAVVMGPKSTVPSWICCATSRSPPSAPGGRGMILTLPPVSSATLSANCGAASVLPCFAGFTLPNPSSAAELGAGRARARARERAHRLLVRVRMEGLLSSVRVGGLGHRLPEDGIVAGEDPRAGQPRERLEPLDRVHRERRIPDDTGRALLLDVREPVAGIGGEDDRTGLGQLDEQGLMPRRVAVGAERGDPGGELRVPVQEPPAIAGQVEVLAIVEALEEGRGIVRVRVLVL